MPSPVWMVPAYLPAKHMKFVGYFLIGSGILTLSLEIGILTMAAKNEIYSMETFTGIWAGLSAILIGTYGMYVQRKRNRELLTFMMACSKIGLIVGIASSTFSYKATYASCVASDSWADDPACMPITILALINLFIFGSQTVCYFTLLSYTTRLFCAPPTPPQKPPAPVQVSSAPAGTSEV